MYHIFNFEKSSVVTNVVILDKKEIILALINPPGANPDIVKPDPTPNPIDPIKFPVKILNISFYLYFHTSFIIFTINVKSF